MSNNKYIPTLITERLVLREPVISDAEVLYETVGRDADFIRYTGWNPYISLGATKEKIANDLNAIEKGEGWSWIITQDDKFVGTVGAYDVNAEVASAELGLTIIKSEWQKGYGSEAFAAVVSYLLGDGGLNRVCAWCHADNIASEKAMRHAGMTLEGVFRKALRDPSGGFADQKWFAKLRRDV